MCIVIVILLAALCVESRAVTGKAFLCRDPDTGKLHTVNSTWPSSSFCGNYHCKLRKKNITRNDFEPIRQINLTSTDLLSKIPNLELIFNKDAVFERHKNMDAIGINGIERPNAIKGNPEKQSANYKPLDGDRYLTDSEIKTISAILHTVKKSDLEAIVEIYQLAQNIYDEIDKTNPESLIQETVKDINKNTLVTSKAKLLNATDTKQVSYWYDPIPNNKFFNKGQPTEVIKITPKKNSLDENSMTATTHKPTKPSVTSPKSVNYFDGALTTKDFRRLPYYYPISLFQRGSSYVHQPVIVSNTPYVLLPATKNPKTQTTKAHKYQKEKKPAIYLPYPFFNVPHNYNWTSPQTVYHSKNYVEGYEMSTNNVRGNNAVLINPDLENIQELNVKPVDVRGRSLPKLMTQDKSKEKNELHDWQTDPISKTILDEVRAHINKTKFLKSLSLRKKIKLDRVAKVVKVDDSNNRNKRSSDGKKQVIELELYEVYLDKTTCNSDDTVPGFFRHGNLSHPFPECCPQRIKK